jgi:hypothetical protein
MKKIIPLLCLVLLTGMLKAQSIHASTSYKQFRYWNPATSKFDRSGDNVEYSSMFVLNGDETMFTHTTNDIKSSYYINKKTYMDGCSCYSYDVTSDVGNKYTFFVDLDKDMIKIMSIGHSDEHDDYLIIFTIKKHWKD